MIPVCRHIKTHEVRCDEDASGENGDDEDNSVGVQDANAA